jgi:hypothetical protein
MIMDVSKSFCHVCKAENELAAIVCGNCGARLDDPSTDSEHRTKTTDMQALTQENIREWLLEAEEGAVAPESGIAFYVKGLSKPAWFDSQEEFVLGRKIGGTSEKLLDLAPFGGYSLGVSRRHVTIRQARAGYEVLDLGSVNGTWLNDERLAPHRAYPLPSGSYLRLGRMQLLVLYQPAVERR